ncbi:MAG: methyltransferase domain-containing protein [Pseudomonadota bacterium]
MSKVKQCRACGSTALTAAFTVEASIRPRPTSRKPRDVTFALCDPAKDSNACGLLQRQSPDPVAPGRRAPSSAYRSNRSHLRAVATEALETISGRDCAALDIGCDDGTLLSYYPRWVDRVGLDADPRVEQIGDWAQTARASFGTREADTFLGTRRFDIITAVSVLERETAPAALFEAVRKRLSADGVFVVETPYAPMALARTATDAFVTGAEAVYSLTVLEGLARAAGLKIFRCVLTDSAGGSIRAFMTHDGVETYDFDPWFDRLARLWDEENALALRAPVSYRAFESRAQAARRQFAAVMASIADRGETVFLLGAGPEAAALYDWAGEAAPAIVAAVAPVGGGADAGDAGRPSSPTLCPGGPPVISEAACRAAEPAYLLAPASLKREMLERWRDAVQRGAHLILPTPEPHLVHVGNYAVEYGKALAGGDNAGEVETLHAILAAAGGPRLVSDRAQAAS